MGQSVTDGTTFTLTHSKPTDDPSPHTPPALTQPLTPPPRHARTHPGPCTHVNKHSVTDGTTLLTDRRSAALHSSVLADGAPLPVRRDGGQKGDASQCVMVVVAFLLCLIMLYFRQFDRSSTHT